MEKLFLLVFLIIGLLAIPYFYQIYNLKKITIDDIPESGSWVNLSRGHIYYEWFLPKNELEYKGTLVLVHGFSTPSFVWRGLINQFLDKGFKVLVYDHFGRGYSERPRIPYDKDLYVETLRELIASQEIKEKVHLVGYSMGGPIVGHYAESYPEYTKSASLIAPAGFSKISPSTGSWITMPIIGDWFWRVFSHRLYGVGNMSETQFSDDPLSINEDEFLPLFQKQLVFTGFNESLLSTVRNFNLFDAREMYRSLNNKNVPISAIWGTLDGVVPYSGSEEFKDIFPNGRLITIEEGTHDVTYRQPTQVGRAIIDFIDSHQD